MATNTSEQNLDITAQMQDLIKDIDVMTEDVANGVSESMRRGGEIIANEQRQLISGKSSKLAGLIIVGKIYVTKKGNATISTGYDGDAIKQAPESVILEFGRPGKKNKGIDKRGRKIGKMEAIPHIRKGFDIAKENAANSVINKIDEIIKKGWNK